MNQKRALRKLALTLTTIFTAFLFGSALTSAARAATFTVDTNDDNGALRACTAAAANDCSLRGALAEASSMRGADIVNFDAALDGQTISLFSEIQFVTVDVVTISGLGADRLTINGGAGTNRVFGVLLGSVTINDLTITGGNGAGIIPTNFGGAILVRNEGTTLNLNRVRVTGNTAIGGGGLFAFLGAVTKITDSTFDNNTAGGQGGAIDFQGSDLTIINSTFSGNAALNGGGGAIASSAATFTLRNSTATNNSAVSGGGVENTGVAANLGSTIVAGNTVSAAFAAPDFNGAVVPTSSFNLIGDGRGTNGIENGVNGNQIGTARSPVDARLAPLAFNNGSTPTHALLTDSPAIDRGFSFGLTADQRGFARPVDLNDAVYPNAAGSDGADIGAFELQLFDVGCRLDFRCFAQSSFNF